MYTQQQNQVVTSMANWLGKTNWETFSTITYRYDIKAEQNRKIMKGLERYLERLKKPFNLFWVTYGAWTQGFDNILNANQGDKSQDYNNVRAIRSF